MMDPGMLAIPFAFILLSALLCWHVIAAKGKWWLKLILIVTVPSFGIAVWHSLTSYSGWPTAVEPPDKALLVWGVVREPDPRIHDPGAIFLWLVPLSEIPKDADGLLDYASPMATPRAYKLPYSRPLHELIEKGKQSMGRGRPVILLHGKAGKGGQGGEEGDGGEGGDGNGDGNGRGGVRSGHDQEYRFYELPPPHPPQKDPDPGD